MRVDDVAVANIVHHGSCALETGQYVYMHGPPSVSIG